jgi:hypothetical protein
MLHDKKKKEKVIILLTCIETWTWRRGDVDMETWRREHGDMDMETWTWRYGHGDMDMETWTKRHCIFKRLNGKRNPRRFSLTRLPFAHSANGSFRLCVC